jgi:GLPGLI family protein
MKYLFFTFLLFSFLGTNAQTIFLTEGRVEYEKKSNQFKGFEEDEDKKADWMKELQKTMPRFITDVYELHFTKNKSVYHLKAENPDNKYMWGTKPSENDMAIQDLENGKYAAQKDVFEQTYLINDTTKHFEWKITGETREIAGFECKKAVTKICDSVYVVAFYTDQIMVSCGPESFGGLPGLILGLAVPRLSTTWFATKVENLAPATKLLNPVLKGKKTNYKQLNTEMTKAMKDWGKGGARNLWKFNL